MSTMKDYNYLYLNFYVLLFACVFETFRKESISSFELDSVHYLSIHCHSWNAMLRFADINLILVSDIEKYQFFESTIRGNISMMRKGYAEANNKFLKWHDANNKPTSYIIYLDVSNLYEHSMMQPLSTEILDWVNQKDLNLDNYSNDCPIGCF